MQNFKSLTRQTGQGMTEYIIIVALIAIAAIGVYKYLGTAVRSQTSAIAKEVSGQDGAEAKADAVAAANSTDAERRDKSLGNYTGGNLTTGR